MNRFIRFVSLVFCFTAIPLRCLAMSPDARVARLHELVPLASDQKGVAADIFRREDMALASASPQDLQARWLIRTASMEEIRLLLTPAQRKVYDRAPQTRGGGLTRMAPETKVSRLDAAVGLSLEQKAMALKIFEEELDALLEIPATERPDKGMEARQNVHHFIRALLNPEQLAKYEVTPQSQGGGKHAAR